MVFSAGASQSGCRKSCSCSLNSRHPRSKLPYCVGFKQEFPPCEDFCACTWCRSWHQPWEGWCNSGRLLMLSFAYLYLVPILSTCSMHVLEFALKHIPMFLRTSATNTLIMSVTLHAMNQIGLILCLSLNIWLLLMPTWYEGYEELNDMVKAFRLSLRLWNQACNLQLLFLLRYGTAVSQESLSLDCHLGEGILAIVMICVSCQECCMVHLL